jgi:hypothetical protein
MSPIRTGLARLARLLDLEDAGLAQGDVLRPFWHLPYLVRRPRQRDLGPDGHSRKEQPVARVPRGCAGFRHRDGRCDQPKSPELD